MKSDHVISFSKWDKKLNSSAMNILHLISRNVTVLEKKTVGTVLYSNILLHWVKGSVIVVFYSTIDKKI